MARFRTTTQQLLGMQLLWMLFVVDTCFANQSFKVLSQTDSVSRISIGHIHLCTCRQIARRPVSIRQLKLLRGGNLAPEQQVPPDTQPSPEHNLHDTQQHQSKSMLAKFILLQNYLQQLPVNLWQQVVGVITKLSLQPHHKQHLATFTKLYALSLLGSSVGFYVFLYFITVGYALGIGLPVVVLLVETLLGNKQIQKISVPTMLHSSLVLLWSFRMTVFLLWREYRAWPALHTRIQQVAATERPTTIVQVLCWTVYSFFYLAMASPVWFRLQYGAACRNGRTGIVLQLIGLWLESLADWQKCRFKQQSAPTEWCHNTGLWSYSTHPNYAGELLFWWGTLLAGLPATNHVLQWVLAAVGIVFITAVLQGAIQTVDRRQEEQYGAAMLEYRQFRQDFGVFGPKRWQVWKELLLGSFILRDKKEKKAISPTEQRPVAPAASAPEDKDETNQNDANAEDNDDDDVVVAEI